MQTFYRIILCYLFLSFTLLFFLLLYNSISPSVLVGCLFEPTWTDFLLLTPFVNLALKVRVNV